MAFVTKISLQEDSSLPELPTEVQNYLNSTFNQNGIHYNFIFVYYGTDIVEKSYKNPVFNSLTENTLYIDNLADVIQFTPIL